MFHQKKNDDLFKIFYFPETINPGPKYLRCGQTYPKGQFYADVYNKFPFEISEYTVNNFPVMTSNTGPAPFSCSASSEVSHYSSVVGNYRYSAFWAFSNASPGSFEGNAQRSGIPTSNPSWLQFNINSNNFYISGFTLRSVRASSIGAFTLTMTFSDNSTYTTSQGPAQTDIEKSYLIPQVKTAPVKTLLGNFTSASRLFYTRIYSVTIAEYNRVTQYFRVPDTLPDRVGYKTGVYIGPDSYTSKFSG